MSRLLPPEHEKGDEGTIGGYAAVHSRPAAFEGPDGFSYSVEIMSDETGDADQPFGAFFLFVQWKRVGDQGPAGHLESGILEQGADPETVKRSLGEMLVEDVQRILDVLVGARGSVESDEMRS